MRREQLLTEQAAVRAGWQHSENARLLVRQRSTKNADKRRKQGGGLKKNLKKDQRGTPKDSLPDSSKDSGL
jgi:hypothetical protein